MSCDRLVEPFAAQLVGVALRIGGAADVEGAVVAGAIAHVGLQDVEERLVARANDPVGEIVRMRIAALAGDGVDRLDVVGAHLVEHLVGLGDDVVLAHARLQLLPDHVVDAVDHGGRLVQQRDLVDVLDLARIQHHLLAVDRLDAGLLQRKPHAGLDQVDADRLAGDARFLEQAGDLLGVALHEAGRRRHGAAHAEHAGAEVLRRQPVAIEPVMHGGGAEVPLDRIVVAGQQREAAELVALPFADLGAGEIADVVDVEDQQRAEVGVLQRLLGAAEAIAVQPAEIDARLEVDVGVARRRQRAVPAPVRIEVAHRGVLGHHSGFSGPLVHGAAPLVARATQHHLRVRSHLAAPCRAAPAVSIDGLATAAS